MPDRDQSIDLIDTVAHCVSNQTAINIKGNSTKSFLGLSRPAPALEVSAHRGVISYEPTELVLTARCGTPVHELDRLLADNGQMMPFEPPVYGEVDTIGGVIAAGLSGPRRAYAGAARDFVLGMHVINGKAEKLRFGGEVMKNVAGYDVSRLQVGAMGTLGVILDVSMKVLPVPQSEKTLLLENDKPLDVSRLVKLARRPLPVSATAVLAKQCWIRLSGSAPSVDAAVAEIGGELLADGPAFWHSLRTQQHEFFDSGEHLWRIAVADHAEQLNLHGEWLYEWGGAQRWLRTSEPADKVFAECLAFGGHATRYRGLEPGAPAFQPLTGTLKLLNQRVRQAFDPDGIFNPGRYYSES